MESLKMERLLVKGEGEMMSDQIWKLCNVAFDSGVAPKN